MAKKKKYEVGQDGVEWASNQAGEALEAGAEVELELDDATETALIAAGWLGEPAKTKKEG